jgi:hypothetical protein
MNVGYRRSPHRYQATQSGLSRDTKYASRHALQLLKSILLPKSDKENPQTIYFRPDPPNIEVHPPILLADSSIFEL